ncbi:MAG: hypothetical protein CO042_02790, partial [Parcubacteria group bacterium CG_4_9_14_0_2_um_filter_41_8]
QGKLKGKKLGRNWYTKKQWLNEYIKTHANKDIRILPIKSSSAPRVARAPKLSIAERVAERLGIANVFTPTRALATSLALTIAFAFIAPPSLWAQWGIYASAKAGDAIGVAVSGTTNGASVVARR